MAPVDSTGVGAVLAETLALLCSGDAATTSWQSLCDAGAAGVLAPQRQGGQGGGLTDAVALARLLTAQGCGLPFLASAVHATLLARLAGARGLLAELTTGDRLATVTMGASAQEVNGEWFLSGTVMDVLHGGEADLWLVGATVQQGWSLFELDRPPVSSSPTDDPTRPVVHARLLDAPARLLSEHCQRELTAAREASEVVRAAEVVAAAELVLDGGTEESFVLDAARSLIDFAAASSDADGSMGAALHDALRHWTSRVSLAATLASTTGADRSSLFLQARATQRSGWSCPGPTASDIPATQDERSDRAPHTASTRMVFS